MLILLVRMLDLATELEDVIIGVSDDDKSLLEATLSYAHSVWRNLQERHTGRLSSHLTLRSLQLVQPERDFLCERFGRILFAWSAAIGPVPEVFSAIIHGYDERP